MQRRLDGLNIQELGCHKEDKEVLSQSTKFSERTFIAKASERQEILKLLSGSIDMETFVNSEKVVSDNGKLVQDLVRFISSNNPLSIPEVYIQFISDISKGSPVAGLLQVTSIKPLKLLNDVATKQVDILSVENLEKLNILQKSLPTFWPHLMNIMRRENSDYLPDSVCKIVIKLIYVRRQTFAKATPHYENDYYKFDADNTDHSSMYYPVHPLIRHPSRYNVSGKDDEDHCEKSFPASSSFAGGIFTIGN